MKAIKDYVYRNNFFTFEALIVSYKNKYNLVATKPMTEMTFNKVLKHPIMVSTLAVK